MIILGVSAFYHDSAAALLVDGKIVAAAQEERFSRLKHDARFPQHAISCCLEQAGIGLDQVDNIVFHEKPFLKFERLLETYVQFAPRGFTSFRRAIPLWIKEKLFQKTTLIKAFEALGADVDVGSKLQFSEHHLSHAASAFYPSPFDEALVLTMDGVGEWATTTAAIGNADGLNIIKEIHFPHSLGLLYSALTYYCGFRVNSGEYKLMGLAPYGQPRYAEKMKEHLIDIKADGSFRLNLDYFDYCTGLTMTNKRFDALFGAPPRANESPLEQRHMDLAASVQVVTEEVVIALARHLQQQTGQKNLCLAGGVALNCVANGKLQRSGIFENVWIQPAAGDAGGALGAALYSHHAYHGKPRAERVAGTDEMEGAYLGPAFKQDDIEARLTAAGAVFDVVDDETLMAETAQALASSEAVGWVQGRMEFGPRALGNRSILGDPRDRDMQSTLNLKIKYRESFRPFAPSVLEERVGDWFNLKGPSPYMLLVDQVADEHRLTVEEEGIGMERLKQIRSTLPAITHVDDSARIQTVSAKTNPRYHALISAFEKLTGCGVVVNTSFNIRGEPIVATPEDAFRCFMGTRMDRLVVGNCVMVKSKQNQQLAEDYRDRFALD